MSKSVVLEFNSEKVHSVRYDATGDEPLVSSIYIKKSELTRPFPKKVKVTVEELR